MLIRSATASPSIHGFHYAPAHSPRQSPSRTSADAAVRRPTSSSSSLPLPPPTGAPAAAAAVTSPLSQPQPSPQLSQQQLPHPSPSRTPRRYVAVDAATQYSPMEPFDYAAHPRRYPSNASTPREPPPTPGPVPMEPGIEQGVDNTGGQTDGQTDGAQAPPEQRQQGPHVPGAPTPPVSALVSTSASALAAAPSTPSARHAPASVQSPSSFPQQAQGQPLQTPSPNKRRSSHDAGPQNGEPSGNGEGPASATSVVHSPSAGPKRVKAEAGPAKELPERYELCAVEDMVVLIANMLSELIETNDALALKSGHLTRFHSRTAPGISVLDYLHRLAKHATLTPPLLLSMVYYIDRLCAMYPDFTINTLTVHRFLITAATVAAKGLSDSFWNNTTYARVGGVRVTELKMLELEFLYRLEWKIVPNPEVLAAYYRPLVERCPGYILPANYHGDGGADPSNSGESPESGIANGDNSPGEDSGHAVSSCTSTSAGGHGKPGAGTSLLEKDVVVSGPGRSRDGSH